MMAFVAMAIVGCSNEPVEQDVPVAGGVHAETVYATIESQDGESDTRTAIGAENAIVWNEGDAITLFQSNGFVHKMVTTGGGNTDVAFDEADDCPCIETSNSYDAHYAVYPFSESNEIDADTETFTVDMSGLATQAYTEGSFESGKAVMVSKTKSQNIYFKNTLSMACFEINGTRGGDYVITSVKLSSASTAMSGTATVSLSDYTAKINSDGGHSVSVVSESGIILKKAATPIYMLVPAGKYTDMVVTIEGYKNDTEKAPVVFTANISTTFKRNAIKKITKTFNSDSWNGSTSDDKLWDGETVTEPNVEDGVMNINTPAEMAWLGTKNGNTLASGVKTVNINGSFDMNGMTFTTLCINEKVTINGNENTISNLTLKAPVVNGNIIGHNGGAGGAAFVNVATGSNVTVKDLTFSGATAIDQEDTDNAKAAIVADNVEGVLILNNVHVTNSTVKGIYAMGGLVNDVQCNNLNGTSGDVTITNCSVTKTTFSNIEVANESGCIGSIIGRIAGGHTTIEKTSASDNVIEAYVCRGNQERTVGDYVGNYLGQVSGSLSSSLVITEGTISNVNITPKNELAESQKNIYSEFLGGWREEGKGTVSINGTEVVRYINTQAEFEAAVKAGGIVFLSENETGEPYTWVNPSKDVTIVGREGLATTRSARPAYATIKFGGGSLNAGASKIAFEKLNLKFTDTDYSGFHHSAEESYKQCNIYECVWTYAPKATFENCYFYQNDNDYNIWMYGANTNDITVKGCEFETDNKSILIYAEGARTYDVTVEDCIFTAARATNKCAIQIHTELGNLSGTLVMNNNTATGYEATNGGLYKEWVNGAIVGGLPKGTITNYFDKTVNGENLNQKVINAIKAGGNVTLTEDLPVKETFTIPAGVTTNLDLNGKTIYIRPAADATAAVDINNEGTLNIKGGKIVGENTENARRCIYNRAGGVMTIDGTEFVQVYESKGAAINNAGEMTIEDATVTSKYWSIWNEGEGELTINGGTFNCNSYDSTNESSNGPTYSYAVKNQGSAQLTVNGGTFNCTHGFAALHDNSTTVINGGVINQVQAKTNISSHAFTVSDDATLSIPADSEVKINWDNAYATAGGSTIVWKNDSAAIENISIVGGLYDITKSHERPLYFKASGNDEYPYQAISAYEDLLIAAKAGVDYTLKENIIATTIGSVNQEFFYHNGGVLDGAGYTITNHPDAVGNSGSGNGAYVYSVFGTKGGTIKNLTVKNTNKNNALKVGSQTADVLLDNCKLLNNNEANFIVGGSANYGVKVQNSTITGARLNTAVKFLEFENCELSSRFNVKTSMTITDCNFALGSSMYPATGAEYTVTLKDCYYDGTLLTEANKSLLVKQNPDYVKIETSDDVTVATNNEELLAAIANAQNDDVIWVAGDFTGCFEIVNKTVTLKAAGKANFDGMIWLSADAANRNKSKFVGLTLTNAMGATKPNPQNSQYYNTINNQYPLVGAYNYADVTFEDCTFNIVAPTVYGFYGYALNSPVFENCTFNCNHIRPIANNGPAITVNGCTFNNQYHYSVRAFENSGELQTVTFTNNTIKGTPSLADDKTDFEGVNFSKKGNTATGLVKTNISGNTAPEAYGLKYRYHKAYTTFSYAPGSNFVGFEQEEVVPTATATQDEFIAALEDGKDVVMTDDVDINPATMSSGYGTTGINVKNGQTIDGGGNVLDITGAGGTWDSGISTTGGLIKNITVTGSFRGIFINHNSTHSEPVVLENVVVEGTVYTISCDQGANQNLVAINSSFRGWTSYAATLGAASFTGCTFGYGIKAGYESYDAFCRPYAPTTFVDCDFEAGYEMDPRAQVKFENCRLDGVALTSSNIGQLVTSNQSNVAEVK